MDLEIWWNNTTSTVAFITAGISLSLLPLFIRSANYHCKGLFRVSLGNACLTTGFSLLMFLGSPYTWNIVLMTNLFIISGASLVGNGIWAFLEKPARIAYFYALPPVIYLILLLLLRSSVQVEFLGVLLACVFLLIIFLSTGTIFIYKYPYNKVSTPRFIASVFYLLSLIFFLTLFFLFDPDQTFQEALWITYVIALTGIIFGCIIWTFGLFLISVDQYAEVVAEKEISDNRRTTDLLVRTIIDSIPLSFILKDRDSRFVMVNAAFAKIVGKQVDELIGYTEKDLFPEEFAAKYRLDDVTIMESGNPSMFYEEFVAKEKRIWIDTIKVPVRDKEGNVNGILVMFRDVTDELAARRALEEEEYKYKELSRELEHRVDIRTRELMEARRDIDLFFEVTIEYLAIIDMEGRLLKTSPSWSKELGWREEEFAGASFLSFIHPDEKDRVVGALKFLASRIPLRDFHIRFRKADGSWIWLSIAAVGVEERQVVILAAHDITLQMELDERLRTARAEAERASRAKSQFIATMSHELRTPLNAVLGYSALLEQLVEDERGKGYLKSISTSGRSLLAIINDILDLTRAEAGRIELVPVPFDLKILKEELGDIFRFNVEEKGLYLRIEGSERLPKTVLLDQARLRQVLVNLVGNAVKFTDTGGVSVFLDALPEGITTVDERNSWKCTIKIDIIDTGIGISEEYRSRLFDSFSQQDPSISRRFGGTGLGLAIAKRLLDLMGGTIRCEAPEAGGTHFRIEIPHVSSAGKGSATKLRFGTGGASLLSGITEKVTSIPLKASKEVTEDVMILMIDDDNNSRTLLAEDLRHRGFDVHEMDDCSAALESLGPYKGVVIGIGGKEKDDMELCAKLMSAYRGVPIIALADTAERRTRLSVLHSGAVEVMRKPVDAEELNIRLWNYLRISSRGETPIDEIKDAHLENLVARLDRLAMTDDLTGLANRRYISNRITEEIARCGREGVTLSVIMGDMDRFKDVNDRYGHIAGDYVLTESAKRIAESLRDGDLVGRWGGEEFLVLLPNTELAAAQRVAERIRFHLGNMPIIYGTENIQVTMSLGVSAMIPFPQDDPDDTATVIIRTADDALYRSKGRGGNRVESLEAINLRGQPVPPTEESSAQ